MEPPAADALEHLISPAPTPAKRGYTPETAIPWAAPLAVELKHLVGVTHVELRDENDAVIETCAVSPSGPDDDIYAVFFLYDVDPLPTIVKLTTKPWGFARYLRVDAPVIPLPKPTFELDEHGNAVVSWWPHLWVKDDNARRAFDSVGTKLLNTPLIADVAQLGPGVLSCLAEIPGEPASCKMTIQMFDARGVPGALGSFLVHLMLEPGGDDKMQMDVLRTAFPEVFSTKKQQ